ncbi:hypothetical protein A0H81_09118 [Grifola frondosa]|uniref:Uncharacterized protein n=1 Tax=Grifola frondosa TaxID=5627 RepID=A0A1C7M6L7_GRIFR|nr:hypothetical protein A0H81_09118 [Grifola frondosa]
MVFGGLGAMLVGTHTAMPLSILLRKVDLRSVFFATVFAIIILILAYLTNPSETSFRTYLTEQSFRQHLSRLDESGQDDQGGLDDSGVHFTLSRRPSSSAHKPGRNFDPTSPFHFVNRASVSLRTPKHVFHSFGIFTIAAVYPTGRSQSRNHGRTMQMEGLCSTVSDAWFIGAFGKWWRGGTIQNWWHDVLANTKDAERCGSGILDVKTLDNFESYDGLPFTAPSSNTLRPPPNNQDSAPRLRGTERSTQRSIATSPRSTTPPPLPKSASLPLHAPRITTSPPKGDRNLGQQQALCSALAPILAVLAIALRPSPIIAEVLRQIAHSNTTVHDLRTQLSDFRAAAAESHAAIQSDLDAHRERKRGEDASRAELKTRTKTLEDSKRSAEGSKRDAEKRLKAAESARDSASQRVERLDKEIGEMRSRMEGDKETCVKCKEEGDVMERETHDELERKKKEIKVAEDVVAALNVRAKELEEKIIQEEERLRRAREQAEIKKQDRSFYPLHVVNPINEDNTPIPWSPITPYANQTQDPRTHIITDYSDRMEAFTSTLQVPHSGSLSSGSNDRRDLSISPRTRNGSLTGLSSDGDPVHTPPRQRDMNVHKQVIMRPRGCAVFDGNPTTANSSAPAHITRFAPFSDSPTEGPVDGSGGILSPTTASLIPTSLIHSLDGVAGMDGLSRSFQSEDDTVLARDWRKTFPTPLPVEGPAAFSSSPTSLTCPSFDAIDKEDPFEVRPPPPRHRISTDTMDLQRAMLPGEPAAPLRSKSYEDESDDKAATAHRRWFSAASTQEHKEKRGLNPEAKVFRLTKTPVPTIVVPQSSPFESLMPHPGNMSSNRSVPPGFAPPPCEPDSLFSSISMRAFAPSPAEREALQRVLGGSTNTSLERLPTLSEVSIASMPPSPSHVHTIAAHGSPASSAAEVGGRTLLPPGLSWLQSLPRMRKLKFSPWDDEVSETKAGSKGQ